MNANFRPYYEHYHAVVFAWYSQIAHVTVILEDNIDAFDDSTSRIRSQILEERCASTYIVVFQIQKAPCFYPYRVGVIAFPRART